MKRQGIFLVLAVMVATILSSCGGGGGGTIAGIGGTGITSSGSITGIGSIYVNGVRYNVDTAAITVNGNTLSTPAELVVGMVVTVTGTLDSAGSTTGTANTVVYNREIQGPVSNWIDLNGDGLIKRFTILTQTVDVSSTATAFDDEQGGMYDFTALANGDELEVSGFIDQNGVLQATRVEKKAPGSEVELKGVVAGYDMNGGAASMGTFMMGNIAVDINAMTDTSGIPGGIIIEGMQVEVKGSLSGTTITASEIEMDDNSLGSDLSDVSLEGIVTGFTDINNTFMLAGQLVDASSASFEPSNLVLANGIKIEVEGDIVNSVLIATDVEARSGTIKLHATVSNVSGSTITMAYVAGAIPVLVDNKTSFKDNLTFQSIVSGNFLEIDGYQDSAGNVIAAQVKRDSVDDDLLQGPVTWIPGSDRSTITVLGVQYTLDNNTSYTGQDENPLLGGVTQFFDGLSNGDTVKIVDDNNPADGIADEVELE